MQVQACIVSLKNPNRSIWRVHKKEFFLPGRLSLRKLFCLLFPMLGFPDDKFPDLSLWRWLLLLFLCSWVVILLLSSVRRGACQVISCMSGQAHSNQVSVYLSHVALFASLTSILCCSPNISIETPSIKIMLSFTYKNASSLRFASTLCLQWWDNITSWFGL